MPLYEYDCKGCDKAFEAFRTVEGREGAPCPDCGGAGVKRIAVFGIHIPAWMSDDGISRTARMREYRKEHLMKRDDLEGAPHSDPGPVKEAKGGGSSPDELVRELAAVGGVDGGARLVKDRLGADASKQYVSLVTGPKESA